MITRESNQLEQISVEPSSRHPADTEMRGRGKNKLLEIDEVASETAYHCTATWHLARLSRAAEMIYSLACVIAKRSHKFFCSAVNLGQYVGRERRQIYRGLQELEDAGFLELENKRSFQSSVYRVIPHKDWAENHPGCCATKQAFPWDGEGDELGKKMYAISGGRHRFLEYEIKILRKCGLPQDVIVTEFEDFIDRWKPLNRQDARYAFSRFYEVLKVKLGNLDRQQGLIFRLYLMSGYIFSGTYKSDLSWMLKHFTDEEIVQRFEEHLMNESEPKRAVRAFCEECREELLNHIRLARDARNNSENAIPVPEPAAVNQVSSGAGL